MVYASLTVDLPTGGWKDTVTCDHRNTDLQLTSASLQADVGIEVAALTGDIEGWRETLDTHEDTRETRQLRQTSKRLTLEIETENPVLLTAAHRARTPMAYPIGFAAGTAHIELRTSRERLSAFGHQLEEAGLTYSLASVSEGNEHDGTQPNEILTGRQREVAQTAIELGYYDSPRSATLTDVAADCDIAKSTCSGLLKRVETALVAAYFTDPEPVFDPVSGESNATEQLRS